MGSCFIPPSLICRELYAQSRRIALLLQGKYHLQSKPSSSGRLVILTGGITGKARAAAHQPSLYNPLLYHGYGLAILVRKLVLYA